ncbi:hypothetical protein EON63_04875 [archaeon]|nr:MAG: hypothetical protein EON63_04875 [archaeon]
MYVYVQVEEQMDYISSLISLLYFIAQSLAPYTDALASYVTTMDTSIHSCPYPIHSIYMLYHFFQPYFQTHTQTHQDTPSHTHTEFPMYPRNIEMFFHIYTHLIHIHSTLSTHHTHTIHSSSLSMEVLLMNIERVCDGMSRVCIGLYKMLK